MNETRLISQDVYELEDSSTGNNEPAAQDSRKFSRKKRRQLKSGVLITDISSGSFRYISVVKKKEKITVKDYGDLSREELGISSDDSLDLYRAGLASIEGKSRIKIRDILVVSSQLDFFIRKLELPLLKKGEVERAAKWEIDKQIPLSVDDSYLKIRKDEVRDGTCSLTVGAVPRAQINRWQFLDKKLIGVVPTPVTLIPIGPPAISKDLSYCYVFHDESLLYIGFYNSRGLQYQHPIVAESTETILGTDDSLINSSRIVDELANSVEVFYSRFPDKRVAGIVLFMSYKEISRLAPLISEQIVIDVIPADFPENVEIEKFDDTEILNSKYIPLLGAVRVGNDDFIFLPKTLEDNIKKRIVRKTIYYGLTAGLITLLMLFIFLIAGATIKKSKLRNIAEQKSQIENSIAYKKSREYLMKTNLMSALKNRFDKADNRSSELYSALGNLTPEKIYLNDFSLKSNTEPVQIEVSGYFDGEISRSDITILSFMDNLRNYGLDQIKLDRLSHKLSGNRKTESFRVTGRYMRNDRNQFLH